MSVEPNKEDFEDHEDAFARLVRRRQQAYYDLATARQLIQKGWCQKQSVRHGGYFIRRTQYCVTGAIVKACDCDLERAIHAVTHLYRTVFEGQTIGDFVTNANSLQAWNDRKGMTKRGILAGFDAAMAAIRTEA